MSPLTPIEIIKRPLFLPLLLLIVVVIWRDHHLPSYIDADILGLKSIYLGRVLEEPQLREGKIKFAVNMEKIIGSEGRSISGTVLVTVLVDSKKPNPFLPAYHRGDLIQFEAAIKEPTSYHNSGGFDYARYLRREGIGATVFIDSLEKIEVVDESRPTILDRVRRNVRGRVESILNDHPPMREEAKGILIALLWGDQSGISNDMTVLFRDNGVVHLLVISGLHFSSLALVLFWISLNLARLVPRLFLWIPGQKIAAVSTFVFLTLYYLICEPSPSVLRAYIGVSCFLIAILLNRTRDLLNTLFLAAIIILLIRLSDLFNLSFQFSFISVLSLLIVYPFLKGKLIRADEGHEPKGDPIDPTRTKRYLKSVSTWFVGLILATVSVFIGLTPLMVFYFHQIQWNGLVMNLWMIPLIELVVVPIGLLGMAMALVVPPIASYIFFLDVQLIEGVVSLLQTASQFFMKPSLVFPPHGWELTIFYCLLLLVCLSFPAKIKRWGMSLISLILIVDVIVVFWGLYFSDRFRITHLDVGQGDAILVELPGAKRVLIDGGGSPYFDVGEGVVVPFLLYRRIPKLDYVFVTHADTDHYLGLQSVIKNYPVGHLVWNGIEDETPSYGELLNTADEKGIKVESVSRGRSFNVGPGAVIDVLSPDRDGFVSVKDNNRSLVLRLKANGYTALLTGDIEGLIEDDLVRAFGKALHSDYLKVPHHGSRTSSSEGFLRLVDPGVATVSAKKNNRFGHPHPKVTARYAKLGIPFYRTDEMGAIEVSFDKEGIMVRSLSQY